eukprot:COSAG06_NODE_2752_length_6344_cov_81.205284_3_plen_140_part_00
MPERQTWVRQHRPDQARGLPRAAQRQRKMALTERNALSSDLVHILCRSFAHDASSLVRARSRMYSQWSHISLVSTFSDSSDGNDTDNGCQRCITPPGPPRQSFRASYTGREPHLVSELDWRQLEQDGLQQAHGIAPVGL